MIMHEFIIMWMHNCQLQLHRREGRHELGIANRIENTFADI